MQLHTHLSFDGNCREAIEFYHQQLGGEVAAMMTWGDGPMADRASPEIHDRIMHACLKFGDHAIMGADATPQYPYEPIKGVSVVINISSPDEAERIFRGLADGGRIDMPLEETFWARRFGMLVDRFGVPWTINCGKDGWQ